MIREAHESLLVSVRAQGPSLLGQVHVLTTNFSKFFRFFNVSHLFLAFSPRQLRRYLIYLTTLHSSAFSHRHLTSLPTLRGGSSEPRSRICEFVTLAIDLRSREWTRHVVNIQGKWSENDQGVLTMKSKKWTPMVGFEPMTSRVRNGCSTGVLTGLAIWRKPNHNWYYQKYSVFQCSFSKY